MFISLIPTFLGCVETFLFRNAFYVFKPECFCPISMYLAMKNLKPEELQ